MSRSALISAVVRYNLKLWVAGLAAAVFVPLSVVALVADVLFRPASPFSTQVLATSARLEASLDVHGDLTDITVADQAPGRAVPSAASA